MRIVLGVPLVNELSKGHLHMQVENALKVGYDEIVFLDDGSTDGTWEVLKEYERKYSHIHAFRNDQNSVLSKGMNRWMKVAELCSKYEPDWINHRACDHLFSSSAFKHTENLLRKQLERFYNEDVHVVAVPEVHLWRSEWWYRTDSHWGHAATHDVVNLIWRYNPNYAFEGEFIASGMHVGRHLPNNFGVKHPRVIGINNSLSLKPPLPIVMLHYGYSSHEKIAQKFKWNMKTAQHIKNRALGMPSPKNMPRPDTWHHYNGYKAAYELMISLKKVSALWYDVPIPDIDAPSIRSLYEAVREYNPEVAEQYKILFEARFGG